MLALALAACASTLTASAQNNKSKKIADVLLNQAPGWSGRETGLQVQGMAHAWYNSANGEDFRFIQREVDAWLEGKRGAGDAVDDDLAGRALLLMYRVTLDQKYYRAAEALEKTIETRCGAGASEALAERGPGGTPCAAGPFLAEYRSLFRPGESFDAITRQFEDWYRAQRGQPAPDATPAQGAEGSNGLPQLVAALVDALPFYAANDPGRPRLVALLASIARDAARNQDPASALLYDAPAHSRNRKSFAAEDAALLVYAWMKGVRFGYLPERFASNATRAWNAIKASAASTIGSDAGALLMVASEMDMAATNRTARGMTVLVDAWYNSQQRPNAAGVQEYFHYKWDDFSDSGYSLFGHMWRSFGAATGMLSTEPTRSSLATADFYVIVSPDIPKKNPNPHYMTDVDASVIADWVKRGGVLVLMENDPPNADIEHMNLLADRFGIHFDNVLHHHIIGEQVEDGRIPVSGGGPLFQHAHTLYMKDTCAISLHGPATALLSDRGDVVMATARFGRGTVFAAVDPWVYNEYTDGRRSPAATYKQFDNFAGGEELVAWLIQQRLHNRSLRAKKPPQ